MRKEKERKTKKKEKEEKKRRVVNAAPEQENVITQKKSAWRSCGQGTQPSPFRAQGQTQLCLCMGTAQHEQGDRGMEGSGHPWGGQKSRRCLTWRSGLCFAGGIDGLALGLSCSPQCAGSTGLSSQLAEPTPLPVLCSVPGL